MNCYEEFTYLEQVCNCIAIKCPAGCGFKINDIDSFEDHLEEICPCVRLVNVIREPKYGQGFVVVK